MFQIWNNKFKIFQVEYAMEAIGHAGTCLGILANDGKLTDWLDNWLINWYWIYGLNNYLKRWLIDMRDWSKIDGLIYRLI